MKQFVKIHMILLLLIPFLNFEKQVVQYNCIMNESFDQKQLQIYSTSKIALLHPTVHIHLPREDNKQGTVQLLSLQMLNKKTQSKDLCSPYLINQIAMEPHHSLNLTNTTSNPSFILQYQENTILNNILLFFIYL